jgi:predicted phosphate transport protein (TIGR00153 family)
VRILLITSRGTGRWVIPKGNVPGGMAPHAAAAMEAEEEAGIRGPVCPTPLGSYRYRKRRSNGASLMVDVDVFPLAVTHEYPGWKEQDQRERRWFTLAEAAAAVDEEDLADLIRSFGASEFKAAALRPGMLQAVSGRSRVNGMAGWFQRLLRPKAGKVFDLFEAHALAIAAASDALARLLQNGSSSRDHVREIAERERDADSITREVLLAVRKTFVTPIDRSAITGLIGAMNDAIEEMNAAARAIDLYGFTDFDQEMRDMTAIIVDAARLVAEAMPLLRGVGENGRRLRELTERLVRMEGHANEIHEAGVRRIFRQYGATDTLKFIVAREIFRHLECIVDALEDVADEIDGIVMDHA